VVCRRIDRWVFLWVDREREELPRDPVESHLEQCPRCRQRAVEVERAILLVRYRCRRATAPDGLAGRIRRVLEDA